MRLALGDVETDGRGVVVLEVLQVGVASRRDLVSDALSRGAVKRGNAVRVSGGDGDLAEVGLLAGLVVVGGALGGSRLELGKVELAVAGNGEAGRLEVLLLGEEEDEAALLALVAGGDVKVKDGGDVAVDDAKEGRAGGRVGLGLVDGDDEVRELVGAAQVGRAGLGGRGRRRRRRRRRAVGVAAVRLESDLAAVGALVLFVVDVPLALLTGGAFKEGGLAVPGDGAVAANGEAAVGDLALVALQDTGRGCMSSVSQCIQVNYVGSQVQLTRPPAAAALVVGNLAVLEGKGRGLDAVAGADLSRGDFADAADDVAAGRDVELASVVADGEAVDDGTEAESNGGRLHCIYG